MQETTIPPNPVNGMIPSDQPQPPLPSPVDHGHIQTADFIIDGNLRMAFHHLKEIYEPPVHSESGPIKPITKEELEREKQKPKEDFVNSLDPTVSR